MGQQTSKDELLYQQVNYGNIDAIKKLHNEGAALEWIDREGKTALIASCMSVDRFNVAKTLIELGANVNAYRPGRYAGTPLHHAAKRGLDQTVKLLLLNGANALLMNDDCQTPLDLARSEGFTKVVRTIEDHICLFSGSMREYYGPGFLELFAPQLLSRKVWVVVLPCGPLNLNKPFKLELALYANTQEAQPRTVIALWKANLEEPNFNNADAAAVIAEIPNIPIPRRGKGKRGARSCRVKRWDSPGITQARVKLASANETDAHQLQRFCNACKGIPQVMQPNFPVAPLAPPLPPAAPAKSSDEDLELAMAINASLQSAAVESRPKESKSGSSTHEIGSSSNQNNIPLVVQTTPEIHAPTALPSAPPIDNMAIDNGPIQYPSVDLGPVESSSATATATTGGRKENSDDSSCVICLDAPVEGACIPCGHMAGCMTCLNEIKGKNWGCPVCRAKIDQVVRLYAV